MQQHQDIISVSYEARVAGVKKHDHPEEAKRRHVQLARDQFDRKWGVGGILGETIHGGQSDLWITTDHGPRTIDRNFM